MIDILTVTMNPAMDASTSTDRVVHTDKLRCEAVTYHPGGGGINVARVIHRLGGDCVAQYPAGGARGIRLREMLDRENIHSHVVEIAQETRESLSVHETSSGLDFRFVFPGPVLAPAEWQACLEFISALDTPPRYVVASGSLPPSVPQDFYASLAKVAKARGSLPVLDSSGRALSEALNEGVYLVKPSLREMRELTGQPLNAEAEWCEAARRIISEGKARIVALSLGEKGALLVTADRALRAYGLSVKIESSIGAGDSFLGGLIWALSRNAGIERAFRYAMAAGAAALLSPGTALCQAADVERLMSAVTIAAV